MVYCLPAGRFGNLFQHAFIGIAAEGNGENLDGVAAHSPPKCADLRHHLVERLRRGGIGAIAQDDNRADVVRVAVGGRNPGVGGPAWRHTAGYRPSRRCRATLSSTCWRFGARSGVSGVRVVVLVLNRMICMAVAVIQFLRRTRSKLARAVVIPAAAPAAEISSPATGLPVSWFGVTGFEFYLSTAALGISGIVLGWVMSYAPWCSASGGSDGGMDGSAGRKPYSSAFNCWGRSGRKASRKCPPLRAVRPSPQGAFNTRKGCSSKAYPSLG